MVGCAITLNAQQIAAQAFWVFDTEINKITGRTDLMVNFITIFTQCRCNCFLKRGICPYRPMSAW